MRGTHKKSPEAGRGYFGLGWKRPFICLSVRQESVKGACEKKKYHHLKAEQAEVKNRPGAVE